MANAQLLKRRIKTAENVSKTTRAMQMIAASKLKRAQDAALSSRPYVQKLTQISKNLSVRLREFTHPFMQINESERTLLLVIAPDKGLCGGMVTNLAREYLKYANDSSYTCIAIGKKIERQATISKNEVAASFPFGTTLPPFDTVYPIVGIIEDYFLSKKVSSVKILYTDFVSIFTQKPTLANVLPIQFEDQDEVEKIPFQLYEPSIDQMLPDLLKHYLEMKVYQHLLENYLSEQASRMMAMQNATTNARDIIVELKLEYNKARQEKITSEILDISSSSLFV